MVPSDTSALVCRLRRWGAVALLVGVSMLNAALPASGQLDLLAPGAGVEAEVPATAPPSAAAATADKDGWWYRLKGAQEGEPGNPLRALVNPVLPAPSSVPANAFAVAYAGNRQDKVGAVGISLGDAPLGSIVEKLTLRLKESTAQGANIRADQAVVVACLIDVFWGPSKNGAWVDKPSQDCGLGQATGLRGADGTWTFDLTDIAKVWLDPAGVLSQNGVLFSVGGTPQGAVQVSWLESASGEVKLDFAASPPPPVDDPFAGPVTTADEDPSPAEVLGEELAAELPLELPAIASEPTIPRVLFGQPAVAQGTARPYRAKLFGDLSPAMLLLIPLLLGFAFAVSLTLGPQGEPSPKLHREGCVSRALGQHQVSAGAFRHAEGTT